MRQAKNREQLLKTAASLLEQTVSCKILFHVSGFFAGSEDTPKIKLLFNAFEQLPSNVETWAVNLANQAVAFDQPGFECANDANKILMAAVPISNGNENSEALVALFMDAEDKAQTEIRQLQLVANAIERWDSVKTVQAEREIAQAVASINEICSRLDSAKCLDEFCRMLADETADFLICLQEIGGEVVDPAESKPTVFVGLASKNDLSLRAISHRDCLPEQSSMVDFVESAMAEALCRNCESSWPTTDNRAHSLLCHQRLRKELQASQVYSIPSSKDEDKARIVMTYAWQQVADERQIRCIQALVRNLGNKVELIQRSEENRLQRTLNKAKHAWQSNRCKTIARAAGIVCLLSLIPLPYRIGCDCEVRPKTRRFVCAPFEARLENCLVDPGDTVSRGQILGTLDDKDIRLELAQNSAELNQAQSAWDGHLVSHQSGEARLAQLDMEKLLARNQLLRNRIDNLELKSPIDGVIVSGDLKDALGIPMKLGDSMFEVAPLDDYLVELLVPEDDVRYAWAEMPVRMSFNAIPFRSFAGTVLRIQPESEIRDGKNVFVAVVSLDSIHGKMRPGMTGQAKIRSVWRPMAWNYLHKPAANCLRWLGW